MDHVFDIFDQYATDPNKELEGVWRDIGPARKDADGKDIPGSAPAIKVARSGNRRHGRVISQLWEANESVLKDKSDPDTAEDKGEEITIEAMSKGILLGWRNLAYQKKPLPDAGTENAVIEASERLRIAKMLLKHKDFRDMVTKFSAEREKYLLVQEEAAAGN